MDLIEQTELHRLPRIARIAIEQLRHTLAEHESRNNRRPDGEGAQTTRGNGSDADDSSLLVDEEEARQRLGGLCPKTMYNLRKQGLPCVKIGTRTMYDPRDLRQWIAQRKTITA